MDLEQAKADLRSYAERCVPAYPVIQVVFILDALAALENEYIAMRTDRNDLKHRVEQLESSRQN